MRLGGHPVVSGSAPEIAALCSRAEEVFHFGHGGERRLGTGRSCAQCGDCVCESGCLRPGETLRHAPGDTGDEGVSGSGGVNGVDGESLGRSGLVAGDPATSQMFAGNDRGTKVCAWHVMLDERHQVTGMVETKKLAKLALGSDNRICLLYTSPSPRDRTRSRMPSS